MKIAIYDNDKYFANKVKDICNELFEKELFINVIDESSIMSEVKNENYEIVMVPEEYKQVFDDNDKKIIYLTKDMNSRDIRCLYKYSDADIYLEKIKELHKVINISYENINKKIIEEKANKKANNSINNNANNSVNNNINSNPIGNVKINNDMSENVDVNAKVLTFVSLENKLGSSTVAAGVATYFAEKGKRVVYINIKPNGGNGKILANGGFSINDFLQSKNIRDSIACLPKDQNGICAIGNNLGMNEMANINATDFSNVIMYLSEIGQFDVIIFDLIASQMESLFSILHNSSKICLVANEDPKIRILLGNILNYLYQKNQMYVNRVNIIFNKFRVMPQVDKIIENYVIGGVSYNQSENPKEVIEKMKKLKFIERLIK